MTPTLTTTIRSRLGRIVLAGTETALSGLWFEDTRHGPAGASGWQPATAPFVPAIEQLDRYFAGALTRFDLSLEPVGTAFQHAVWARLRAIPYGTTTTYGTIAREIGRPRAVRAVGAANGRNPISIIVPCHRVVGSDGSLTGYGGGLARKRALLELEAGGRRAAP